MNGVFKDDAERDRAILESFNNSKLILEKLSVLDFCIEDHERRIRQSEHAIAQHKVWIGLIGSGISGIIIGIAAKLIK